MTSPLPIPYQKKYFQSKMGESCVPVRLQSSYSTTTSLVYIVMLDYRGVKHGYPYRDKIANLLRSKWRLTRLLPDFD